jgi:PAS domain S-box-containing protein
MDQPETQPDTKNGDFQMRLLLIGSGEAEFAHLRKLMLRAGNGGLELEHVISPEDALQRMLDSNYDLLLCEYKPADGAALRLLHDLRESGLQTPVIFLSDHIDQVTVAAAINAGAYDLVQTSTLDESSITRAIRYAIDMYCKDRQRQKAEDVVRKLSRAVEQSADMVLITDRGGTIEYVNPSFETLTGYSRKELLGKNPRIFKSGKQPVEFYQKMWDTILSGQVFRGVMINKKKSGELYFAEKTITPLRDADGSVTHFISNDRDITETRNLESQLQQAQKMDAIGRLAGGVAHDFNNLLMVISAYSELTIEALPENDPSRRRVQEVLSASRRAADLTRQLLAFGRKQMQSLQVVNLNRVLEEICRMLPRLIGEDIQLNFVPQSGLAKVKVDPIQIEQVVMNLAANARDAMPHGGKLAIETMNMHVDSDYVSSHPMVAAGDYVLVIISDSGQGIPPEHLANIFEPFYTTKEEGLGTGLGLATVYGIVKQSGGFVWVYSELGLGTTFKIYLPQVKVASESVTPIQAPSNTPVGGTETLLLVEDEVAVRQSTREFLTMNGYHVLEARNGEEALSIVRSYPAPIHLMITDVVMPHIGGGRLAEQMAIERPQTRVLFVSGYAESTLLRQGIFDVTHRFLQKPFTLRAMANKVREILSVEIPTAAEASPK